MNVVVLIAGVHDPKWPIPPLDAGGQIPPGEYRIMSPFDEAALEMALRLRDADAAVRICARVGGGAEGLRMARAIAALNVPDVAVVSFDRPWDQASSAQALAALCGDADLILIGREFGDFDDGLVPPLLAEHLGVSFFGRAQTVEGGQGIRFGREREGCVETLALAGPAVVSVTNDRRTRLRKPLMKNVMLARQAPIAALALEGGPGCGAAFAGLAPGVAARGASACTMVAGSLEQQARALAAMLWEARA